MSLNVSLGTQAPPPAPNRNPNYIHYRIPDQSAPLMIEGTASSAGQRLQAAATDVPRGPAESGAATTLTLTRS